MIPILVALDDMMRHTLESTLREWGYEVTSAASGAQAWALIQDGGPRTIVTGWKLPDFDATDLCLRIRSAKLEHRTHVIALCDDTGSDSMKDGIAAGVDDFIRKPVDSEELRARILAAERVLKLEQTVQEQHRRITRMGEELVAFNDRVDRDLEMAGQMQISLLPPRSMVIAGVMFERMLLPSTRVSGDIVNVFRLDEHHIGFYAVDVAGHGVAAAMLSFTISHLLTPEMNRGNPLKRAIGTRPFYELVLPAASAMQEVNLQFQTGPESGLFFTMVYGIIDTANRSIDLCQAGHPNPLHLPKSGKSRFVGDGGFPVGITRSAHYESRVFSYDVGDRVFIYSDGVTECMDPDGEMFGEDRLREFLDSTGDQPLYQTLKGLRKRMCEWKGGERFDDDVSVLAFEIT